MMLELSGLGIVCLVELLLWLPMIWRWRKLWARSLMLIFAAVSGVLLAARLSTWTVLLVVLNLYHIINLLRVVENRVQVDYLYHGTRRTALWLSGLQLLLVSTVWLGQSFSSLAWWYLLAILQLLTAVTLLAATIRHLRTTRPPALTDAVPDRDLPPLTIAIPARNETEDLEACLQSLVASTYPKLEILVLDDCSQNRHTPEIIRGFAHDGVRFVAGSPPPPHWLAKNHAYAQLTAEANGELLLFAGVDVRFEPQSLNVLVKTMLQKQKAMISIMPRNRLPAGGGVLSLVLQPNRYAWELALPRRLLRRPPVLSTCWIISRDALQAAGGFKAVSHKGVPESYLARVTALTQDGYSFLQSDVATGISCQKQLAEQRATAIRTRYLQLHRRPELVAQVALAELALLVWPAIMLVAAIATGVWPLAVLTGLSLLLTCLLQGKIINLTYRRFLLPGYFLLPIAALYDIGLLNYSLWQYEFNEVLWKGRNVCVPVMRVIPPKQFTADLGQK